jgi:DNA recombination protein RmuC
LLCLFYTIRPNPDLGYNDPMNPLIYIFAAAILIALVVLIILILKKGSGKNQDSIAIESTKQALETSMKLMMQNISDIGRSVDQKISGMERAVGDKLNFSAKEMHETIHYQATESSKVLRDVTEKLTKLDETNKQVVGFADQLQNLQDILKNPKQRGILGEYYLETLLKNVLPPGSFQMQYGFADASIVDAVVFVKDKIIPIDSKFSLENYNRLSETKDPAIREQLEKQFRNDLKARIDETSKYIKPQENTLDFAFMFIPHEAIYYDLLIAQVGSVKVNTRDLIEYAFNEKHVIIVSPTSFLAYLQTVLQGLKALQIEESAKEIRERVGELGKHISSFEEYMQNLGKALGLTVSKYNLAHKELKKVDKDIMRIAKDAGTDEALKAEKARVHVDVLVLEKPGESDENEE